MDDFFLGTSQGPNIADYRVTPAHMDRHVTWQRTILPTLPGFVPGTDIKLDLPFNGNGVLEMATSKGACIQRCVVLQTPRQFLPSPQRIHAALRPHAAPRPPRRRRRHQRRAHQRGRPRLHRLP